MELQRLQWSVSSETGERLSLLFLDRQSTKATNLHTYAHSLYTPAYYIQVLVYIQIYRYTDVQYACASSCRQTGLVVSAVDESCQA